MTKINFKNNKTTTTILCTLAIGLILLSPITLIPKVSALPELSKPKVVENWLATHPHFEGCIVSDLKTGITKEVACKGSNLKANSFSWSNQVIDCSSNTVSCKAGAEFDEYSSYNEVTANSQIGSKPSSSQTGSQFSYWNGLTNCSGYGTGISCPTASLLVQSGWLYDSSLNAVVFAELWGNFYINNGQTYCGGTNFCGNSLIESPTHNIYTANYADPGNKEWVSYVEDDTAGQSTSFMVPFSTTGQSNSLPYPVVSLEAYHSPDKSYFPTSPISFTNITLYEPGVGQVNADTNYMLNYYAPTSSSGITMSFSASGTTTATATNSWS